LAPGQRGWTALTFVVAAMIGLFGWSSGGKTKQSKLVLRGGQPDDLARTEAVAVAFRYGSGFITLAGRETGGMSMQMPVRRRVARLWLIALFGLATVLAASGPAGAATAFSTLYGFCPGGGTCADGDYPAGYLTMDAAGNLYGATQTGGNANSAGVVFKLTPNQAHSAWTQTVLYSFCPGGGTCADGRGPNGSLITDTAGNLYGTTFTGGNAKGAGVVFELMPNQAHTAWTQSVLYRFCPGGGNCTDGEYPYASLIMDASGNLYGTTRSGGGNDVGVVFQLTPNQAHTAWTQIVLYSLCAGGGTCADGSSPSVGR
jgi:uncharacterized repeat protein (TIGR03803 family)